MNMNTPSTIGRYKITLYLAVMTILAGALMSYALVSREYQAFNKNKIVTENEQIHQIRLQLDQEIKQAINYIDYIRSKGKDYLKKDLKTHIIETHTLIENIYNFEKKSQKVNTIDFIKTILSRLSFNDGRGYYFVIDMNGDVISHGGNRNFEGTNFLKNPNTREIVQGMIDLMKRGNEGFYEYKWYRPNDPTKFNTPKIVYLKKIPQLNLFVGTGEYIENIENNLRNEVEERIKSIRFLESGIITISNKNSATPTMVQTEKTYIKSYYYSPWDWTLSASVKVDSLKKASLKEKRNLDIKLKTNIALILLITMGLIFMISLPLFNAIKALNHAHNLSTELNNIIQFSGDGFLLIDQKGTVKRFNNMSKVYFPGLKEQDNILSFLSASDALILQKDLSIISNEKENFIRYVKPIHGERYLALSISIIDHVGTKKGERFFSIIARDMTEHHQQEEQLVKEKRKAETASQSKTSFLNNISHEIKTPINSIQGLSEILQQENELTNIKKYLTIIEKNSLRLTKVIDKILDFTRTESNVLEIINRPFNIKPLLDEVVKNNQAIFSEKDIKLTLQYQELGNDHFYGDPFLIKQVFHHIIENAYKFTPSGSIDVTLFAKRECPYFTQIVMEVTDSGIGISSGEERVLLKPFEQKDLSHTRKVGGSGLGLSLVNEMIKGLNGSLHFAKSNSNGTKVRIQFELSHQEQPFIDQNMSGKEDKIL